MTLIRISLSVLVSGCGFACWRVTYFCMPKNKSPTKRAPRFGTLRVPLRYSLNGGAAELVATLLRQSSLNPPFSCASRCLRRGVQRRTKFEKPAFKSGDPAPTLAINPLVAQNLAIKQVHLESF